MSPWMWVMGSLVMLLFFGGLALLVAWGIRTAGGPRPTTSNSALEVLQMRLAAGQITQDEYESTRRVIQG